MFTPLDRFTVDDARLGGKGRGLARLVAAGLPVPPTWVLVPGAPLDEEHAVWAELPPPLIVRSSASVEDGAGAAAPGIFTSVAGVRDRPALRAAVDAVRAAATGELARAWTRATGRGAGAVAMTVLVQPLLPGARLTLYTRAPGRRDEMLAEIDEVAAPLARDGRWLAPPAGGLVAVEARALASLGADAEAALDCAAAGADVELIVAPGGALTVVQARAIVGAAAVPAAAGTRRTAADWAFSAAEPGVCWRWDATHNPAPLSPAQAGLVELVEAAGVAGVRQRVVDGYLFYAAREAALAAGAPAPATAPVAAASVTAAPVSLDELTTRLDAALAPLLGSPSLDVALDAYVAFVGEYARLASWIAAPRRALVAAVGATRAAELVGRVGVGPALGVTAWDVAVAPPPAPAPAPQFRARALLDVTVPPAADPAVTAARLAAALAEHDDALFAAAQLGVRRALLAAGAALGLDGDAVFFVALPAVRAAALAGRLPPEAAAVAAATVAAARATCVAQERRPPPVAVVAGRALNRPAQVTGSVLRGRGGGGQARGPAWPFAPGAGASPPRGAVVVVAALLPGMALDLAGARALVAEHGGLLGHGAALARELGIPHVVGCSGALAALGRGDDVLVDGDAGVVLRLGP